MKFAYCLLIRCFAQSFYECSALLKSWRMAGGKRVLFDYCHRRVCEDEDDPRIDLKKHLQDELKAAKRDAFD